MAPVHRTPHRGVRMVLVVDLVAAIEVGQAVGVIDPARLRGDVESGVPAVVAVLQELRDTRFSLGELFFHR